MSRDVAWLGNPKTKEVQPAGQSSGDLQAMVWLPDEATARAWQELSRTGNITDKTPPPAPTDVAIKTVGDAVVITWQAQADPESGIRRFLVYRDGRQIGEVGGRVDKGWNPNGNYHAWNYSDQPLQGVELPAMQFEDHSPGRSATAKYQIATENQSRLSSSLSQPSSGP